MDYEVAPPEYHRKAVWELSERSKLVLTPTVPVS